MTTIPFRDGVMASDTGSWSGNSSHGWANKLARGPDGALFGTAGTAAECETFLQWVRSGYQGEMPKPRERDDGSTFLVLTVAPGGPVELITAYGRERYDAPYYAIGASSKVAFGALYMGADAAGAILAAMEHGSGAFGDVRTITHEALR